MCVDAMGTGNRTDQSGFDEGTPLVHQHSLSSNIILMETQSTTEAFITYSNN